MVSSRQKTANEKFARRVFVVSYGILAWPCAFDEEQVTFPQRIPNIRPVEPHQKMSGFRGPSPLSHSLLYSVGGRSSPGNGIYREWLHVWENSRRTPYFDGADGDELFSARVGLSRSGPRCKSPRMSTQTPDATTNGFRMGWT